MTRQDFLIKWGAYALALLPVWFLELFVLNRFPVLGVTPMLLPLAAAAVGVLEGAVAGVGMSITLACDFSIVEETAKMVFAFVNIGFVPDGGVTYLLSRLVGPNKAAELLMSGKRFTGAQARDWGLVTEAVPKEQLEETVRGYIKKYANGPSVAYAQMKRLLFNAAFPELNACMQNEVEAQYVCSLTEDHREALTAFVEKRIRFSGAAEKWKVTLKIKIKEVQQYE